ncbi:MAG: glycosyltransferase family 2 protein [Anaerolineales bacterium]|nr:glycosyltransferase family 2 protein [Anaerolineales bacterium]
MISVVIPVHNAETFLREAVASALQQPEVTAVILTEDGSTDGSVALCASLARESRRVFVLHHPGGENRGPASSRNLGIGAATTEFVAFLDADDLYLPGRFRKTLPILAANAQVDGVYEAVEELGLRLDVHGLITLIGDVAAEDLLQTLAVGHRGSIHLNGITVRRTIFDRTGMFPEDLPEAQDTVWIVKAAATARLQAGEITRPVAILRVHDTNRVTRRPDDRRRAMDRSRRRNGVLLEWAASSLGAEGASLLRVFAARRMAEARTVAIRNRRARSALKRLWMIWYARSTPSLWFHPAFRAAMLPRTPVAA